jgi:glycerol dehydrogenase-like iron-containing ADH family enzyme
MTSSAVEPVEASLEIGAVVEVFGRTFGERPAVVVADATTWRVAGQRVQQALEAAGRATQAPYRFEPDGFVLAEYGNVERLERALSGHDAVPVAVGSGSLNDIVKRAAHEAGRPYLAVATAASMDGYTAFGAAITRDGYKQTMSCPANRSSNGYARAAAATCENTIKRRRLQRSASQPPSGATRPLAPTVATRTAETAIADRVRS